MNRSVGVGGAYKVHGVDFGKKKTHTNTYFISGSGRNKNKLTKKIVMQLVSQKKDE